MAQSSRRYMQSTDSSSLWNFTLSPGWTSAEIAVLRLALMKVGCGRWQEILRFLPGKTVSQLNLQAQRLFGQQSLAEFAELHVDPLKVFEANAALQGDGVVRKNGMIVNQGAQLTAAETRARIAANRERYGISKEEAEVIEVPAPGKAEAGEEGPPLTRSAKLVLLELLHERRREVEERLEALRREGKRSRA